MGGNKKGEERKFEMQIFEQINPYKSRCIFFSVSLCLQLKISLTAGPIWLSFTVKRQFVTILREGIKEMGIYDLRLFNLKPLISFI